tara:strand:+ start:3276 stop:3707 length:432 start_codon:yes stop_codon:yes gene_type:complete
MKKLRKFIRKTLLNENPGAKFGLDKWTYDSYLDKIADLIMSGKLGLMESGLMMAETYGLIEDKPPFKVVNEIEGPYNYGLTFISKNLFLVDVTILDPDLGNRIWAKRNARNAPMIQEPPTHGPAARQPLQFPLRIIFGYLERE